LSQIFPQNLLKNEKIPAITPDSYAPWKQRGSRNLYVPSALIAAKEVFCLLYSSFLYSKLEIGSTSGEIEAEENAMTNIENRDSDTWRDENLLIVYAVEGYAHRHNMTTQETLKLFREYGVTTAIRQCYGTLHTQDYDETVYFAEDFIAAR
jgi:hypothetical protein